MRAFCTVPKYIISVYELGDGINLGDQNWIQEYIFVTLNSTPHVADLIKPKLENVICYNIISVIETTKLNSKLFK